MTDFSQLFLYIPGIIIFLIGSGQMRDFLKLRKLGSCIEATVLSCNHIRKTNPRGQDIYNYYAVSVTYPGQKSDALKKEVIKSPVEYLEGQPVKLYKREAGLDPILIQSEEDALFHPFAIMCGGALLVLLALFQNQGKEIPAMVCLSAFMIGCGVSMIISFLSIRKKDLIPVTATVTSVYKRQISKESKILKADKFAYYPVVSYEIDGIRANRKCISNSGSEKTYREGDTFTLYYDKNSHAVLEQNAKPARLVWGLLLTGAGILAAISILSVL